MNSSPTFILSHGPIVLVWFSWLRSVGRVALLQLQIARRATGESGFRVSIQIACASSSKAAGTVRPALLR